jgi:hypothetical protein
MPQLRNMIVVIYNIARLRQVLQLKIWHFWVIGTERNVCRFTFNRYSVITHFAILAAGEQLCFRCTHRKLQRSKTFTIFSWKITDFDLWHCCRKRVVRPLLLVTDSIFLFIPYCGLPQFYCSIYAIFVYELFTFPVTRNTQNVLYRHGIDRVATIII